MSDILFDRRGAAGVVTLNRTQALNAINHEMVRALRKQLDGWATDDAITRVVVTANGKVFCAGGDVRAMTELGKAGRHDEALAFWRDEYALNAVIKTYRKPYVSLIDGLVMGGGVGITVHGSHRVAGDRYQFAMPEAGIGFFPDVGGTWFLPRMPGESGAYCALTGERFNAADACHANVATHRIPSERFASLLEGLYGNVAVEAVLSAFSEPAGEGSVSSQRAAIDSLFAGGSVETILSNLDNEHSGWAHSTAATIRTKSPVSLKLSLAQIRHGRQWDFATCMRAEFRIVSRVIHGHDFYEGVRALLIDKDNKPRWNPASLQAVSDADIERHFDPVAGELDLP